MVLGLHCDVGGGYRSTGLSDVTLRWMVAQAARAGLRFSDGQPVVSPDPLAEAGQRKSFYKLVPAFKRQLGVTDPAHEAAAPERDSPAGATAGYAPANLVKYRRASTAPIEKTLTEP